MIGAGLLRERYMAALQSHLELPDEGGLALAYEIGRAALNDGLGVLDMADVHHAALRRLAAPAVDGRLARAGEFFAECLSPFEMSLRGYRETNAQLTAMNDKLQRAHAAAEIANRELESFSYSVAHDLRAPLRGIDGFSQALIEDYTEKLDAEGQKYLRYVREAAQRMAQLIDDLLTLSRVTRSELQRERIDLSGLARSIVAQLQKADAARHVTVVVADGLVDTGDTRLVRVALENLLGNAWKFTGKCEAARIEFGALDAGGGTAYFVRDNGAGFDMQYAGKLFGVFQRLHAGRDFEGTGIGLATVHRIVTRHGGRIWAEGAVERGATFYFTLGEPVERGTKEGTR